MNNSLVLQLALSFLLSGFWIAGATLLSEKLGTKWGGLVANLPSNIVVSVLFIAIVQNPKYAADTTVAVPLGMAISAVFLFVFIVMLRYSILVSTVTALFSWFILAILVDQISYANWFGGVMIYLLTILISIFILNKYFHIPHVKPNKRNYSIFEIIFRATFAGCVVCTTVLLSKVLDAYFVGLFTSFPAVLLTSMVILSVKQSSEFAQAIGKILIVSSTNIVIYAFLVGLTYPELGIFLGTIISYLGAFLWVLALNPLITYGIKKEVF